MGAGDFTAQTVRVAFFDREREACFRCRRPLRFEDRGMGWSAHHRMPRQMGGTSDPVIANIANCAVLCGHATSPGGCHAWVEKYRHIAEDHGYIVRRGINAPAGTRIKRLDGTWWLLTSSGLAVECEGATE